MPELNNIMIMPGDVRATENWQELFTQQAMVLDRDNLEAELTWIYNAEREQFEELFIATRYEQVGSCLFVPRGEVVTLEDPIPCPENTTAELNMQVNGCARSQHHCWGVEAFAIKEHMLPEMETKLGKQTVVDGVHQVINQRRDDPFLNHARKRQEAILHTAARSLTLPAYLDEYKEAIKRA